MRKNLFSRKIYKKFSQLCLVGWNLEEIQSFVWKDEKLAQNGNLMWEISLESKLAVDVEKSLQSSFLLMERLFLSMGTLFVNIYLGRTLGKRLFKWAVVFEQIL